MTQNRHVKLQCATIIVLMCVVTSGCITASQQSADLTTTTAATTEAVEYPDQPESDGNTSILNYTKAYERSLATERARNSTSGDIQSLAISINNATVVKRSANGTLIHFEYKVGMRAESKSGKVSSSDTQYTVNYYVTNGGEVYRAGTQGLHRPGPDPRTNGTIVTTF